MKNSHNTCWILAIIVGVILLIMAFSGSPLLSPSPAIDFECGGQQGQGGGGQGPSPPTVQSPPPKEPPRYANCVADGLAKLDADAFEDIDEGQLRYDITVCLQDKGLNPVANGVPMNRINDALECKKSAMEAMSVTETLGTGKGKDGGVSPPIKIGRESPFKDNCPAVGSTILYLGTGGPGQPGHAATCKVLLCNPKTGHATLDCTESGYSPNPGYNFQIDVGPSGNQITNPINSMNGGNGVGWVQITSGSRN